jgi:transposase
VVAPSLIPKKERIKTNRCDAVTLARLFRAGELTSVWSLTRSMRRSGILSEPGRPQLRTFARSVSSFLPFFYAMAVIYSGSKHWTKAHARRLAAQAFERPA